MVIGRKPLWALAASMVAGAAGIAATSFGGAATNAPVRADAPVTEVISELDQAEDDDGVAADEDDTTTTTGAPTTTAAPATTTTAAPPPTTAAPAPAEPASPPPAPARPPAPSTTAAPPPPPPPPQPSGPKHGTRNTGCEQYMHQQINAARARVGRHALAFDTGIQYIAVDWSDGMAGRQVLAHNPNYASQILRHRDYRTAGENVGRGYDQASLFQAFMNSPAHRQNIEHGAYSHVTVGCVTDRNGQLWVTQNFWG